MPRIENHGGLPVFGLNPSRKPLFDLVQRAVLGSLIWSSIICLFGMMFVSVFVLTIEMGWVPTVAGIWFIGCLLTVISWNWSVK